MFGMPSILSEMEDGMYTRTLHNLSHTGCTSTPYVPKSLIPNNKSHYEARTTKPHALPLQSKTTQQRNTPIPHC